MRALVDRELRLRVWERGGGGELLEQALPVLARGTESPYAVAARIVAAVVPPETRPNVEAVGPLGHDTP